MSAVVVSWCLMLGKEFWREWTVKGMGGIMGNNGGIIGEMSTRTGSLGKGTSVHNYTYG